MNRCAKGVMWECGVRVCVNGLAAFQLDWTTCCCCEEI